MAAAVKLTDEIVASARQEAQLMKRSLAGQIEHWASIGRAIERSAEFSYERLRAALAAQLPFDALSATERAVANRQLIDELKQPIRAADAAGFEAELRASGVPYSGTDERYPDHLVSIYPDGRKFLLKPEGEGRFVIERELHDEQPAAGRAKARVVVNRRSQRRRQNNVLPPAAETPP